MTALASSGQSAADKAKTSFGDKVLEIHTGPSDVIVKVVPAAWKEVHAFFKTDGFNVLLSIAAVDWIKENLFWVVSHLYDSKNKRRVSVKTEIPRAEAHVASLSDLWAAANWHERECFDLSGVKFDGHPDLRRILCPDDWEGHALRKDYKAPDTYHGIVNNVNLIDLDHRPPLPEIV